MGLSSSKLKSESGQIDENISTEKLTIKKGDIVFESDIDKPLIKWLDDLLNGRNK